MFSSKLVVIIVLALVTLESSMAHSSFPGDPVVLISQAKSRNSNLNMFKTTNNTLKSNMKCNEGIKICGGVCCDEGVDCCGDNCCSNHCCGDNVCCANSLDTCCGSECCSNYCCGNGCCESDEDTCCGGYCCPDTYCCGDKCCLDQCCEGECCPHGCFVTDDLVALPNPVPKCNPLRVDV